MMFITYVYLKEMKARCDLLYKSQETIILSFICMILWSLIPVLSKAISPQIDISQYLVYSNFVSFIFLLPMLIHHKIREDFISIFKTTKMIIMVSIIGFLDCIYYLILYFSFSKENPYIVTTLQYTWPIMISIYALFLFREKITLIKLLSMFIAFIAIMLVSSNGNIFDIKINQSWIVFSTLFAAFVFASLSILSKLFSLPPMASTIYLFGVSFLFSLFFAAFNNGLHLPSMKDVYIIIINGGLINGYSYVLWIRALQKGSPTKASIIIMFTPILSLIFIAQIYNSPLAYYHIIAVVMVVIAGILTILEKEKKIKSP